ncbi:MAG: putative Ig domain-containing protein [Phycisphaerae bacterium]|nr:putative Ig domain-containing protein [Phycisphaerae bacterium]
MMEPLEARVLLSAEAPPIITSLASYAGNEGVYISIQNQAVSQDGTKLTWTLDNPPPHSVAHASGLFQWTPRDGQDGTYVLTWTVTDAAGGATTASTTFTIRNSPSVYYRIGPQNIDWPPPAGVIVPVMTDLPTLTATAGREMTFDLRVTGGDDGQGGALEFQGFVLPAGSQLDAATGRFTWTPTVTGVYTDLQFLVRDSLGYADSTRVTITVSPNRAPVWDAAAPVHAAVGMPVQFVVQARTAEGVPLTYSCTDAPAGATFDAATCTFAWTPAQAGEFSATFLVSDGIDSVPMTVTLTVSGGDTNQPPVFDAILPQAVAVGVPLRFTIHATDPDGNALTYACINVPLGATFDPVSRTFMWTPSQVGEFVVTFTAFDGLATTYLDVPISVHRLWAGGDSFTYIDRDGDGYGVGSPLGPDANDNDPDVNTFESALAKYGTVGALLNHLGYDPLRIFYVDPGYYETHVYIASACAPCDGQTDVNDPSQYFPYVSWDHVVGLGAGTLRPGDAVIFRAGTYGPDSRGNAITLQGQMGTEENPILIMGMPGERVTLTQAERGIYMWWDGVNRSGHLVIDNFDIEAIFGYAAISIGRASDVTIRNVAITSAGLWGVSVQYDVQSIRMENMVIRGQGEHGVYIACTDDDTAGNISITGSLIYGNNDNGIHVNQQVDRIVIDGNILHGNNKAMEFDSGPRNVVVTNNVMFDNYRSAIVLYHYDAVLRGRSDMTGGDMFNMVFANNTILGAVAVTISNENTYSTLQNGVYGVTFANNVISTTQCVLAFVDQYGGSLAYRDRDGIRFVNNVVECVAGGAMRLWNGTAIMLQFMMPQWQQVHAATVRNNVAAAPQFRSLALRDFELTPASPALGLGLAVDAMGASLSAESLQDLRNALAHDVLGMVRGQTIDAGAYQYPARG